MANVYKVSSDPGPLVDDLCFKGVLSLWLMNISNPALHMSFEFAHCRLDIKSFTNAWCGVNTRPWTEGSHRGTACTRPTLSQPPFLTFILSLNTCYCLTVALASLLFFVSFLACFQLCCVFLEEQPDSVWGHELAWGPGRQGCWLQHFRGLDQLGTENKAPFAWELTLEYRCHHLNGGTINFLRDGGDLGHIRCVIFTPSPDSHWTALLGGFIEPENKEGEQPWAQLLRKLPSPRSLAMVAAHFSRALPHPWPLVVSRSSWNQILEAKSSNMLYLTVWLRFPT